MERWRAGHRTPVIDEWPSLQPGLELYWEAFQELTTDRPVGMGVGPIPFSSIATYAQMHGLTGADFDELLRFIRAMDREWMAHQQRDRPSKTDNGKVTF